MFQLNEKTVQKGSATTGVVVVLVLAVLAFFGFRMMKDEGSEMAVDTKNGESTAPAPEPAPVAVVDRKKYADGSYTADGSYIIPNEEKEVISVSLTIKDGIITSAEYTGNPIEAGSKFNQGKFSEGYKAVVVGKNIDEVALTVVNGASLTPKGFMEALEKIKADASAQAGA